MAARFFAVQDRDDGGTLYALMAMSDQLRPGFTQAYRWMPNFDVWVVDRGLKRDFRSFPGDQLNEFEEIDRARARDLVRELPRIATRWVLDAYKDESERLTSADLGLESPSAPPDVIDAVRKARPGEWVSARVLPAAKYAAARKWVSEIRLGKKARWAQLGPLEARLVRGDAVIEAYVRRATSSGAVVAAAQRIAEAAHAGQLDKAGQPYIDHLRRVAGALADEAEPAEAVAAGWLHDVLEDTDTTPEELAEAGVPSETIEAVQAVTRRSGQAVEDYAARIAATPLAVEVKRADMADNSDPGRLALLDRATRVRLTKKYDRMRDLLDSHDRQSPGQ
ncbi:HD domain-containing protein [Intrasporangium sp.]|uniref:HD domain-containing protein n=1 Tax=Intrasporangium sp. TaxID=1925024 RepID=UPI003221C926